MWEFYSHSTFLLSSMLTVIFQGKVIYFSLIWCYLILVLPASVTLGCFFPFQLSTTEDITQKAEENLSVYFLYLHVLTKCLLILRRSIWALNINISCFILEIKTGLELHSCRDVFQNPCFISLSESIVRSTSLANAYTKGWGQMTSDVFPGYSIQYLTYIKTTRICYSLHSKFILVQDILADVNKNQS